jgi:hypothetical protein
VRTAPKIPATNTANGAPKVAAPLLPPVEEGEAAPLPLLVPLAPLAPLEPALEPELDPLVEVAVAAAKSCVEANVWQLLEEGMEVVYGGTPTGPTVGWNQVVVAPGAVVNTPGGVMSSLSQTSKVPLIAGYCRRRREST